MIIDTHVHYWQANSPERPWDKDGHDLGVEFLVERLLEITASASVDKIVQVTPSLMGYDNRYSFEGAKLYPEKIAGVFARFDPTGSDMPRRLEELRREPAFLGIRLTLLKPPWDSWLAQGTLEPLWEETAKQGVPVAIFASHQARLMRDAALRHPQTRFLVDHMALHRNDPEPFALWADTLSLADATNIWIKVSYFPEVSREPYPFRNVQRKFRDLYECFGPKRLIWGSNFPPSGEFATYAESVDLVRKELSFLSDADRDDIMGKTFLAATGIRLTTPSK